MTHAKIADDAMISKTTSRRPQRWAASLPSTLAGRPNMITTATKVVTLHASLV